jgi:uncharacterized OB-fold protein
MIESYDSLSVPAPIPTLTTGPFWEAARRGELALQCCDDCKEWFFYPRKHCPHCWSNRVTWQRASGEGVVKSFSVVHRPGHVAWAPAAPYVIALIQLHEGPTMLSQLAGSERLSAHVGQNVKVCCLQVGEFKLPFFELENARQA